MAAAIGRWQRITPGTLAAEVVPLVPAPPAGQYNILKDVAFINKSGSQATLKIYDGVTQTEEWTLAAGQFVTLWTDKDEDTDIYAGAVNVNASAADAIVIARGRYRVGRE